MTRTSLVNRLGSMASRWWEAAKLYVEEERKREGDITLFADFESLAKATRLPVDKLDSDSIRRFLGAEGNLFIPE